MLCELVDFGIENYFRMLIYDLIIAEKLKLNKM